MGSYWQKGKGVIGRKRKDIGTKEGLLVKERKGLGRRGRLLPEKEYHKSSQDLRVLKSEGRVLVWWFWWYTEEGS